MTAYVKIDFVSDISCPWCAIGLYALEAALKHLGSEIKAEIHFQPFELNPGMPQGGQDITEHLTQKYGSTPEQQAEIRETIRLRGAELGFIFRKEGRDRIYNTFDAHRLLHWAGLPESQPADLQPALKKAMLHAYFTEGESPESHDVLLRLVGEVGLNVARAQKILGSNEYAAAVREQEHSYTKAGIHSVPAVIINEKFLISGGQPVEVFERSLRQLVAEQL
ncbi:MAG: DsbA family oxidoreductase [Sterolibacterium sp.]